MELTESEAKYRNLVESLDRGYFFYTYDKYGDFSYVSSSISKVLGYKVDDFKASCNNYLTENYINKKKGAYIQSALNGHKCAPYELEIYHKNGSIHWLEITESPVFGELGQVLSIEGIAHDITELKQSAIAIAELASKNTMILESAGEGIFGLDQEGRHTFINSSAAKMLGRSVDELLGKKSHPIWHSFHPDKTPYPEEECPIYKILQTGKACSGEEYFIPKNGDIFPVEFTANPIIEAEKVIGAVVSFLDISKRKQQELRLHQSLQQSVQAVAAALEKRDPYTAGHQRRVTELAIAIAKDMHK